MDKKLGEAILWNFLEHTERHPECTSIYVMILKLIHLSSTFQEVVSDMDAASVLVANFEAMITNHEQ
eukprot:CAMPEP_0201282470 /NCGR_PEP_ID=MMETSP1317-20130820/5726_1 /ASSEMBLY_ACC=CAM_ASM_000770 /TAXON_ID=187299 /ORGANISM="Undescribed Undescribed, Strain Undescribed" /LENGTH=66 /DNA_ID=CAMNT_0047595197 /DNA_START=169 /DNA_END=372 /DNA_ORIENTATION=+